jgi:hypothetical protein
LTRVAKVYQANFQMRFAKHLCRCATGLHLGSGPRVAAPPPLPKTGRPNCRVAEHAERFAAEIGAEVMIAEAAVRDADVMVKAT